MKWLRGLVLTETLEQPPQFSRVWYVCYKTGKDETGSGLSIDRPTTFDAALREAAQSGEIVFTLPKEKPNALQSI